VSYQFGVTEWCLTFDTPWVSMVWQAYYRNSVPQVTCKIMSFWWLDICSLLTSFCGASKCSPGNGTAVLFWIDFSIESRLATDFARLYPYALDTDVSLHTMLACTGLYQLAHLFGIPLPEQAYQELDSLRQRPSDSWVSTDSPSFYIMVFILWLDTYKFMCLTKPYILKIQVLLVLPEANIKLCKHIFYI
jgi:hypothetical protein